MLEKEIKDTIRDVRDFPKKGIVFRDITPVLEAPLLCDKIVNAFIREFSGTRVDAIAGVESRGFLFGMVLAQRLHIPFVTIRKKGRLPFKTYSYKYDLEYGMAEMEMHVGTVKKGWRVIVHDDLLATGGTAAAASELIMMQGGIIAGFAFLIELSELKGSERLIRYSDKIAKLVTY